jgi:Zn finger protein HypA/HybF involved in hydrogenase expression
MLQTEFEFTLPHGYVDSDGALHRDGAMRLATAADEILPMRDSRVQTNRAYLTIILLSRVVVRIGEVNAINTKVIENLFAADLAFLQRLYRQVNENATTLVAVECPKCEHSFKIEPYPAGG